MSALLTAYGVAVALFAWFMLVKVVPDCGTSHFRYRLWALRDELVDEIRAGEYEDEARAQRFVAMFEWAIEQAADLSVLNVILLHLSRPHRAGRDPLDLEGLAPADASRLQVYRDDFERAMAMKALGTPSGWIFMALALPAALVVVPCELLFRRRNRGRALLERVRRHAVADFDLNPALGRKRRRPLYQHI